VSDILSDFVQTFSLEILIKVINTKFHENPSSGSRINIWWYTDMVKLEGSFRDKAKAPKYSSDTRDVSISPKTSLRNVFLSHKFAATYAAKMHTKAETVFISCVHYCSLIVFKLRFYWNSCQISWPPLQSFESGPFGAFVDQCRQFIAPTKYTALYTYIRHVSVRAGFTSRVPRALFR